MGSQSLGDEGHRALQIFVGHPMQPNAWGWGASNPSGFLVGIRKLGGDEGHRSLRIFGWDPKAWGKHGIEPLFAMKRDVHHLPVFERFAADPPAPVSEDPVEQMAHRLKTRAGRALYALRKHTVEPVFGIIKHVMGFRQFSLRGLDNVSGEWCLAIMAWNIKRMHRLTAG